MNPLNLSFSYFVLGVFYLAMAIYAIFKNFSGSVNKAAGLLGCSLSGWAFFTIGMLQAKDAKTALFWAKLFLGCVVFIPCFNLLFIHFFLSSISLPNLLKKRMLILSFIFSFLFLISDITPLLLAGVSFRREGFYFKDPGLLYHVFELYFFSVIIYSSWLLFKAIQLSPKDSVQERQCLFLLLGLVISYLSGSMSYLLAYGQVSPEVVSIGNYGAVIYSIAVYFAIRNLRAT